MEDDDIETSSAGGLLPLALAILAIILGGAGLYFGMTANQRLTPLAETMNTGSTNAAQLENEVDALGTQLDELSAQYSELESSLGRQRLYGNQREQTIKQVASSLKENREKIVEIAERLNEFMASTAKPEPAPTATITSASESATGGATLEATSSGAVGTYTIQAGDNFGKIAKKLDVGLQALLDANPDADPRRLRIGQVIQVPQN